jgi:hypothetical protein
MGSDDGKSDSFIEITYKNRKKRILVSDKDVESIQVSV